MRTLRLLICAACLVLSSCSYKGALRDNFYQPELIVGTQDEEKLPLKVALVVDEAAKAAHFQTENAGFIVDIAFYPGMFNAVKSALQSVFKEVEVIDNPLASKDANLLVYPVLDLRQVDADIMVSGRLVFESRTAAIFKDRASQEIVSTIERLHTSTYNSPPGVQVAKLITGMSLGLLAPITIPYITHTTGKEAERFGEAQIQSALPAMFHEAKRDPKLTAYIERSLGSRNPIMAGSGSGQAAASSDVDTIPSMKASARPNAYGIIVGIERYREQLPKADFASHDAKIMGEYLTKVLGYPEENVVVLLNEKAAQSDIVKYVESWLPNHVDKDSSVFIYFSGHGAPNPRTGEAYLVPYDGDPSFVDKTGYSLKRLYEHMAKIPAKEVVVMLDSCFSGTGGRSVIASGMRPMLLSVENPLLPQGHTIVLAASAGDQVSTTYLNKKHGLLSYYFFKGLQGGADRNQDGALDLAELFEYVKPHVQRVARQEFNTEQTPQLIGSTELLQRVRLLEKISTQ